MKNLTFSIIEFDYKFINQNTFEMSNLRDTGRALKAEFYDDFIGCSDGMNLIWEAMRDERKKKEEFN